MQHDFSFDPTHGYDLDALLKVDCPKEPDGFASFWEQTFSQAMSIELNITRREVNLGDKKVKIEKINFDSLDGVRIGGWIATPRTGAITRAVVVGHGYGGRIAPELELAKEGCAVIYPCARGFGRSKRSDLPNIASKHVLHGIEDKNTYILRGCVADYWLAGSALLQIYPDLENNLQYIGGSFGGGIGALMLAWDKRFKKAHLNVPSFGHHPLRITLRCTGSGESVRNEFIKNPDILDVLSYFDAALAAKYIEIPVLCRCALFDPAVPPPGQFAVNNGLNSSSKLLIAQAGHFEYDQQEAEAKDAQARIFEWLG